MFMMGSCLLMTVFLMTFVLPRFATIYESRSATLPTPTRVLLAVSNFFVNEYLVYGPILGAVIVGLVIWFRLPSGRTFVDWIKLHLPILRGMFSQLYITRFARTMSTLLAAGVNLLDIIDICRGVTNNRLYDRLWDSIEQGIRDGKQISDAICESSLIPSNVASMIASGERSGRLSTVMERIAEFSDQELDAQVKKVTSYIEPLMIMFMGVVIGGVAMALLLPIFSMGKVVSGG
jgi:type IV pilus assembly protein PilC